MRTIKLYIERDFADAVPVIAAFILLQAPTKNIDGILDDVTTCIGEALESKCSRCSETPLSGVLFTLSVIEGKSVELYAVSLCPDCTASELADEADEANEDGLLDDELLDIEALEKLIADICKNRAN